MSGLADADLDHLKYEFDGDEYSISNGNGILLQAVAKPNMTFSIPDELKKSADPEIWEQYVAKALPLLDSLAPLCRNIATAQKLSPEIKSAASRWVKDILDIRERASQPKKTIIGVFGNTGDGKSSTINALLGEGSLLPTNCMRACTACVIELSYNHEPGEETPYRAEIDFISRDACFSEVTSVLNHLTTNDAADGERTEPSDRDAAKFRAKVDAVYPGLDSKSLVDRGPENLVGLPEVASVLGATRALKSPSAEELRDMIAPYTVRIYTKAGALANGVTIVDLPGHQDWDAGRAAVASDYMKSCAGIWIVAPINRAVDNKTAKELMGDHFKRQLHLDGSFKAVTVICSKTDDMTLESAVTNLKIKLDPETKEAWAKAKDLGRKILAIERQLKSSGVKRTRTNDSNEQHDAGRPSKKARTLSKSDDAVTNKTSNSDDAAAEHQHAVPETNEKEDNLDILRRQRDLALKEVRHRCIQRRNEIARGAMRQYFANILRELNQQPAVGDAHAQIPDYEALSRQLPVFCTSTHVYQGMEGLLEGEQKLTEELRISKHKEVFGGICGLLNSISIWTQNASSHSLTLDPDALGNMLTGLQASLEGYVRICKNDVYAMIRDRLYRQMDGAQQYASSLAVSTASGWAAPRSEGGLAWSTLRACFQRNGVFKERNFNEDISEPFMSGVGFAWDNLFRSQLPRIIDQFTFNVALELKSFRSDVVSELGRDDVEDVPVIETLN
ncbi:hypothetical protein CPLU01_12869 [Colletotrichum plurivorum]|uniref:Dynamin N-terminal domain-containing protein n=1 Tax=Colletotrichum plurivorum TaxID=2175906 RepID=A0A8H6JWJ5_9PEZI|nr:hypothetical protein CPLU01_12869 [Colletotrichum plurivorum]